MFDLGYPTFFEMVEPPSNTPYSTTPPQQTGGPLADESSKCPAATNSSAGRRSPKTSRISSSPRTFLRRRRRSVPDQIKCCAYDISQWEAGRCCPGPIYDNNTETGDGRIRLRTPRQLPFPGDPGEGSSNGSHILMSETADSLIHHPGGSTCDSEGRRMTSAERAPVRYVGMTSNGSTVYFTREPATEPEDTDTSLDLYVWHHSDPKTVTLVSNGSTGEEGNRDNCRLSWVEKCDVQFMEPNSPAFPGESNGNSPETRSATASSPARAGTCTSSRRSSSTGPWAASARPTSTCTTMEHSTSSPPPNRSPARKARAVQSLSLRSGKDQPDAGNAER